MSILSTGDKILIAMLELSGGSLKPLKYEDIVVAAWRNFPRDFGLRGYEYPDSSDIHKPLYGPLKTKGFVRTANKFFSLTEHGLSYAIAISSAKTQPAKSVSKNGERLTRDERAEIDRLLQSDALRFFEIGEKMKILDTDIYHFYGVTVRTGRNEFLGRIATIANAIEDALKIYPDEPRIKLLANVHQYLISTEQYSEIIPHKH